MTEQETVSMACCCGATLETKGYSEWVTQRMRMFMEAHKGHTPWTGKEADDADTDAEAG